MEMHKPETSDHPAALSIRRSAELSNFTKRVTCKLASRYVERDAIFKLRYQSYLRAGLVSKMRSDDTLNQPTTLTTPIWWGYVSTAGWSVLCAFRSAPRQLLVFRHFNSFQMFSSRS